MLNNKPIPYKPIPSSQFFSSVGYDLGGLFFSLNDIENGILRANRASFGTLYRTPFGKGKRKKENGQ